MYYKLFLFLTLLIVSSPLKAQEVSQDSVEDESGTSGIRRYKYEIATNLQWIFPQTITNYYTSNYYGSTYYYSYGYLDGQVNNLSLFGRINKSKLLPKKYKTRRYAYRFGVKVNAMLVLKDDTLRTNLRTTSYLSNNKNVSFEVETGYEIQKQFKKFQLFYGVDLGLVYHKFSYKEYQQDITNNILDFVKVSEPEGRNLGVLVSPLVGMKYFINSRISFSLESKYNVRLFSSRESDKVKDASYETIGLNMWTEPINAINLSYYFNL